MTDINFEITCPFIYKNKIVNYIKDYVYQYDGDFDYIESGIITKYLKFYISIDEKYEGEILNMYNQLKVSLT